MLSTKCIKSFHAAIATAMVGAIFAANPARAEDPAVHTPSVMNQKNSEYAETLKFYLHPARLEVIAAPRELMDHPSVSVAKAKQVPPDATAATLATHPAVAASKPKRAPIATTANLIPSASRQ